MAGEYQFSLIDVTKQVGTKTILKDVNLSFFYGAHIGVIGANGAGKSSLLKILAGLDTDLMGTVQVAKGTKVGYLPQEPELDDSKTVLETVMEGVADAQAMVTRYEDLCCELDDPKAAAEMERLQAIIDANDYWNLENLVERRMADLGCPDGSKQVGVLSGGERRRVAITRLLLSNPDVLLLDEPTNHLDAETTFRLEAYLKEFKGTLIVVTHDRYFLSDVTEWILELDHGICYPYKGNYEEWLKQKEAMLAREAKVEKSRQKLLENSATRSCRSRRCRRARTISSSASRLGPGLATSSCAQSTLRWRLATRCSTRISTSTCRAVALSASLVRTAPERRRSSSSSRGSSSRSPALSRSATR